MNTFITLAASVGVLGIAAGYLLLAWCDGSIFAGARGWLSHDMLGDIFEQRIGKSFRSIGDKLTELLLCPLCLSPYLNTILWAYVHFFVESMPIAIMLPCVFASAAVSFGVYRKLTIH